MADRKLVANGNMNVAATFDGGTLPADGDTIYANNFTGTFTADYTGTAYTLRTSAGGTVGANAGGSFTVAAGADRTVNANLLAGTTACMTNPLASGFTLTLNGNVTGGSTANAHGMTLTGGGATIVNGNVVGGTSGAGVHGIHCAVNHQGLTVNGTATGSSSSSNNVMGVNLTSTNCPLTVTGAIIAGSVAASNHGVSSSSTGAHVFSGGFTSAATVAAINMTGNSRTLTLTGPNSSPANSSVGGFSGNGVTDTLTITGAFANGITLSGSGASTQTLNLDSIAFQAGAGASLVVFGPAVGATLTVNVTAGISTLSTTASIIAVNGAGTTNINLGTSITGPSSVNGVIIQHSVGTFNFTGDAYGGAGGTSAYAINISGVACIFNHLSGTAHGSPSNGGASGIQVTGNISTGAIRFCNIRSNNCPNDGITVAAPGVGFNSNTGNNFGTFDNMECGSGGYHPAVGRLFKRAASVSPTVKYRESNAGVLYTFGANPTDYPVASDVRNGTTYNSGATTGTLIVPPVGSVALGVPTDNTVGTAGLTPATLLGQDLLDRLEQCATVDSTGAQIAASSP